MTTLEYWQGAAASVSPRDLALIDGEWTEAADGSTFEGVGIVPDVVVEIKVLRTPAV